MRGNDDLEGMSNLALFRLLFDLQEKIIAFWRNLPKGDYPTEQQALELAGYEAHALLIEEVLEKRGKLPKSWGKK